jgi:hypothetical protein
LASTTSHQQHWGAGESPAHACTAASATRTRKAAASSAAAFARARRRRSAYVQAAQWPPESPSGRSHDAGVPIREEPRHRHAAARPVSLALAPVRVRVVVHVLLMLSHHRVVLLLGRLTGPE